MSNVINELIFSVTALIIILLLLILIAIPFFVRYSQTFLMYRNRFRIETDVYQKFWKKISFYDSIVLTFRLYALQEMSQN